MVETLRSEEICSDPPRQRFFIGGRVAPIMFALTPGLAPRAAVEIGVGPRIRRHELPRPGVGVWSHPLMQF